ncbi:MAG: exodeoxyribonuclease III [Candidatus Colwellbacteria bacterium]|nr:exodeoxyribonuclease III [Candidatus Colwellbacteria bacterium]
MKIISWNVNGIRAACRNGFLQWLDKRDADIVCLQEVKADKADLEKTIGGQTGPYGIYSSFAEKRGYSGVTVLTKENPLSENHSLGLSRFDNEGRIVELEYPSFTLLALYIPHGGREKENLPYKIEVYEALLERTSAIKKPVILAGDFNVAHQEIDLARPRGNANNIMFTPKEREQLNKLISLGFTDSFRKFNSENGNYTWWPYRNDLRNRNVGWRIDYIFASNSISPNIKDAFILKNDKGSDHCPIGIEIDTSADLL